MPDVHPASLQSLCLELLAGEQVLHTATGFVVDAGSHPFLVTSWHVVAGRDPATARLVGPTPPDAVRIHHHAQGGTGTAPVTEPLLDTEGDPLWATHPTYGPRVDLVALPLTQLDGVALHSRRLLDLGAAEIEVPITADVSVVGFPFGPRRLGERPVWTRGTVATEHGVDYDGRPCFLVDARTGKGQSGAPVLLTGAQQSASNGSGPTVGTQLVGVYSGRVSDELDLGFVWRSSVVTEVLVNAQSQVILRRFSAS